MITLDKDERMHMEVRKHPFVIVSTIAGAAFALVLPFVFLFFAGVTSTVVSAELITQMAPIAVFLYALWALTLWMFVFIEWTDYYLDAWYVTDRRIVDVEQRGIFHREVISFRHDSIQDITVDTGGIIQTLLGFGDIHIQTAGAARKIVLKGARDPDKAKEHILKLHNTSRENLRR